MYEMSALRPPFKAADMNGLFKKVCQGTYPQLPNRYSPEFKQVIDLMLRADPRKRPTCEELLTRPSVLAQIRQLSTFDENVVQAI